MNQGGVASARNADYLVGMRNLALADMTAEDLAGMLSENETLFVEHKGGLERRRPRRCARLRTRLAGGFSSASRTAPRTTASRMNGVRLVQRRWRIVCTSA
jgi:hypothetical protein